MNYFQVERLPDALRTLRRLAICFIPAFVVVLMMQRDGLSNYDPVHSGEVLRFQHAFNAGMSLAICAFAVGLFSASQADARSLLCDEGGSGWLSIHGWDRDTGKLPQRGLLPISELLGMLVVTGLCSTMTGASIVFLPMCWSLIRLATCWKTSAGEQAPAFGTVWLLHATAILWSETLWLAIPFEFAAIVLTECLVILALRRKAEELVMNDVTLVSKQPTPVSSRPSPSQQQAAMHRVARRLYPFSQLNPVVDAKRPSWMMSLWIATVIAWMMFCITARTVEFGEWKTKDGRDFTIHGVIGAAGMFSVLAIGMLRLLTQFEPFVWTPRIGPIARIRMLRPIIWSWDRVLFPVVLAMAIVCLSVILIMSATPAALTILVFVEVLLLWRCGVTPEEWQMTSDSRLSSAFLSSGQANHRGE